MPSSDSFLRQLSSREGYRKSTSKRFVNGGDGLSHMRRNMSENGMFMMKKRVMVVVDESSHSKHAMMWALTHVANRGDILTLLHILPCSSTHNNSPSPAAASLAALCKASKPEVEVEALVIEGQRMETVKSQVKKLEVCVLVLGQKKPSPLLHWVVCMKSRREEFVEECINSLECLTIGVQKQSQGVSGYLISTRWHKNFWLLA